MRVDDSRQVTEDSLIGERQGWLERESEWIRGTSPWQGKKRLNDDSVNLQFLLTLTSATMTESTKTNRKPLTKDVDMPQRDTTDRLISLNVVLFKKNPKLFAVSMVAVNTREDL